MTENEFYDTAWTEANDLIDGLLAYAKGLQSIPIYKTIGQNIRRRVEQFDDKLSDMWFEDVGFSDEDTL